MVKLADRRGKARERKGKEEAKEDKKIGRKTLKLFLACSEMSKKAEFFCISLASTNNISTNTHRFVPQFCTVEGNCTKLLLISNAKIQSMEFYNQACKH